MVGKSSSVGTCLKRGPNTSIDLWVSAFLVAVIGLLLWQIVSLRRWEKSVIALGGGRDLVAQRLLRLRSLGWFAIVVALGQRALYRTARSDWLVDGFTAACLLVGTVLVGMAAGLAKRLGR